MISRDTVKKIVQIAACAGCVLGVGVAIFDFVQAPERQAARSRAAALTEIDRFLTVNADRLSADARARAVLASIATECAAAEAARPRWSSEPCDCEIYRRQERAIEEAASRRARAEMIAQIVGRERIAPLLPSAEADPDLARKVAALAEAANGVDAGRIP